MAKSSSSFEKGNRSGMTTRFASGTSGNSGGRPVRKAYTDAYRRYADLPITELKVTERDAAVDAIVKSILRLTIKGNVRAAMEAADRTEGRVPLPLATREDSEFVLNVISHIPRPDRSQKNGHVNRADSAAGVNPQAAETKP